MRTLEKDPQKRVSVNEVVSICNLGWTDAAAARGMDAKLEGDEEVEVLRKNLEEEKRKREEAERGREEEKNRADEEKRRRGGRKWNGRYLERKEEKEEGSGREDRGNGDGDERRGRGGGRRRNE